MRNAKRITGNYLSSSSSPSSSSSSSTASPILIIIIILTWFIPTTTRACLPAYLPVLTDEAIENLPKLADMCKNFTGEAPVINYSSNVLVLTHF